MCLGHIQLTLPNKLLEFMIYETILIKQIKYGDKHPNTKRRERERERERRKVFKQQY